MADEKTTVKGNEKAEAVQPKKENKFVAFIKKLPRKIATPFKNMWHELKKVTWPTKKDLISYTCIVLLFMVFMGVVIGLLDMGASKLVTAISSLKATDTTADAEHDHEHDHDHEDEGVTEPDENATVGNEETQEADQQAPEAPANGN